MDVEERSRNLGRLWWLTDAPMFIDRALIGRIHDALIWPEFRETYEEKTEFKHLKTTYKAEGSVGGEAEIKLPELLEWLAPKLKAKAALEGTVQREGEESTQHIVKGERVESAERKLNDIVVEYLAEFPERVLFLDVPGGVFSNYKGTVALDDLDQFLDKPPRPLVFVNIRKGALLFPTMAEMEGGGFRPIFPALDEKFLSGENPTPRYDDADQEKRKKYWAAIERNFRSRTAMQELEKACEGDRIGWIDFRILFDGDGDTGHLHIVPAGTTHAGVFGYNFVHRGYKYGCRLVASLKSGRDLNVLAIYER